MMAMVEPTTRPGGINSRGMLVVVLRESCPVRNLVISQKPSGGVFSRSSWWGSSSIWCAGTGEPQGEAELESPGPPPCCSCSDIEPFSSLSFDLGGATLGHPGSWECTPLRPLGKMGEPPSSWDAHGLQLGQPAHWVVLQPVEWGVLWGLLLWCSVGLCSLLLQGSQVRCSPFQDSAISKGGERPHGPP